MKGQTIMGQKKKTAELEDMLADADDHVQVLEVELREAQRKLNGFEAEKRLQRLIADRKAAEERREKARQALEDLSNGIIHLDRFEGTRFAFTRDEANPEAEITLILDERQAKILNAYATKDRKDPDAVSVSILPDLTVFNEAIRKLAAYRAFA